MRYRRRLFILVRRLALAGTVPALAAGAPPARIEAQREVELRQVVVSPDGRALAFSRSENLAQVDERSWQVWIADRDGGNARPVLDAADSPAFSPDGTRLAASRLFDGDREIVTLRTDGTDLRRLTHRRGDDLSPVWTPDGGAILFVRSGAGEAAIRRIDLSTGAISVVLDADRQKPAGDAVGPPAPGPPKGP